MEFSGSVGFIHKEYLTRLIEMAYNIIFEFKTLTSTIAVVTYAAHLLYTDSKILWAFMACHVKAI